MDDRRCPCSKSVSLMSERMRRLDLAAKGLERARKCVIGKNRLLASLMMNEMLTTSEILKLRTHRSAPRHREAVRKAVRSSKARRRTAGPANQAECWVGARHADGAVCVRCGWLLTKKPTSS